MACEVPEGARGGAPGAQRTWRRGEIEPSDLLYTVSKLTSAFSQDEQKEEIAIELEEVLEEIEEVIEE